MLNIPESVKALYKTDGTRKNFRVQFPNGEMADLTNADVVRESVHFTESICSQNVFRFGLAEASVIEFETVGVGNMYGMTIACSYEIDAGSLSAAEISAIQSDSGDGELVLASASDIGYGFYRIPLGVFRVERCPRNHGATTHRQVTGYGVTAEAFRTTQSEFEAGKNALWFDDASKTLNVYALLAAKIGTVSPQFISDHFSNTRTIVYSEWDMTQTTTTYTGQLVNGTRLRVTITAYSSNPNKIPAIDDFWYIRVGNLDFSGALDFIRNAMSTYGDDINKEPAGLHYFTDLVRTRFSANNWLPVPDADGYRPWGIAVTADQTIVYPYNFGGWVSAVMPTAVRIEIVTNNVVVDSFESTARTMPAVQRYTPLDTVPSVLVTYQSDGQTQYTGSGTPVTVYQFNFSANASEMLQGLLEVWGEFAKDLRGSEGFNFMTLSPSSPLAISPGDYDECWWDEYDVSPIGTVTVTYRNGEEGEATANVTLGAGASLYDMTDNEVLKNLSTADLDSITTLLSGGFATNAQNVGFTPIEMTMQGWPWLEAGDALQITAEDGTVVNTYALRVEMSGIQHLMSDITAEGGEIIGEV